MNAIAGLAVLSVLVAVPAFAQDVGGPPPPPPPPASRPAADMSEWRAGPAENLLVIDTTKGRVLGELTLETRQRLLDGVELDDGPASFASIDEAGGEGAKRASRGPEGVVIFQGLSK